MSYLANVLVPSVVASVAWGTGAVLNKFALGYFPVSILLAATMVCSAIFAVTLVALFKRNIISTIKHNYRGLVLVSIIALLLYIAGYSYLYALNKSKYTSLIVVIAFTLPIIITSLLSYKYLNEKLNKGMLMGYSIVIIGIIISAYYGQH